MKLALYQINTLNSVAYCLVYCQQLSTSQFRLVSDEKATGHINLGLDKRHRMRPVPEDG